MPVLIETDKTFNFGHLEIVGNAESNAIPLPFSATARFYDWHSIAHDYPNVNWQQITPLDEVLINSMRDCEVIALRMMDRNSDDIPNSWSYETRKKNYLMHLRYWNHVIKNGRIDFFLALNVPHEVIDFIIFHICRIYTIPTLFFYQFQSDIMFLMNDWRKPVELVNQVGVSHAEMRKPHVSARLMREYNAQSNPSLRTVPFYMARASTITRQRTLRQWLGAKKRLISKTIFASEDKAEAAQSRRISYQTKNKNKLSGMESDPIPGEKYFYFPLHFQPELSTSPMAGPFVEQQLIIDMLNAALPDDVKIYIKEHPNQSMARRSEYLYDTIAALPKVRMIHRHYDSLKLLENSLAVVTATGTAGWEGALRRKPVVLFGTIFYQNAPSVLMVKNFADCKNAVNLVLSGNLTSSSEEILLFLENLDSVRIPGNIDIEYEPASEITREECMKNIASRLNAEIGRLTKAK